MLSDEEKKAIERIEKLVEYLKKWNKNFTVVPEDVKYFEKILDMTKTHIRMIDENIEEILEQSKEIEELNKENTRQHELIGNIHKKWEDKIKAKIELKLKKLDKQINEEWKKYGNSKELQDVEDMYNFLQSLLEKE